MENLKGGFARAFVLVKVAPRSEGDQRLAQYTFVATANRVSAATDGRGRGRFKMVRTSAVSDSFCMGSVLVLERVLQQVMAEFRDA